MGVRKEDLYALIDQLSTNKREKAYDYLKSLIENPTTEELEAYWSIVDDYVDPVEETLSEETERNIKDAEYITWDQLKRDAEHL